MKRIKRDVVTFSPKLQLGTEYPQGSASPACQTTYYRNIPIKAPLGATAGSPSSAEARVDRLPVTVRPNQRTPVHYRLVVGTHVSTRLRRASASSEQDTLAPSADSSSATSASACSGFSATPTK